MIHLIGLITGLKSMCINNMTGAFGSIAHITETTILLVEDLPFYNLTLQIWKHDYCQSHVAYDYYDIILNHFSHSYSSRWKGVKWAMQI